MARRHYPFVPKSTRSLTSGDFWAVPLLGGRYACGRVIQLAGDRLVSPMRAFFGGLHDWLDDAPPTSSDLAGQSMVAWGVMHIKAITETGGEILGNRSLELDGIEPPLLLSAHGGRTATVLRGVTTLRVARHDEWGSLPVLSYWSYDFIQQLAESRLVRRR
jgi:hypothetical protein